MADYWSAYSFFALIEKPSGDVEPRRLATTSQLQTHLTTLFDEQDDELRGESVDSVPFDGRYFAQQSEVFRIKDFDLPAQIEESLASPESVPELSLSNRRPPRIKTIYGGAFNSRTKEVFGVFQEFNSSRLLVSGRTVLFDRRTFRKLKNAGLTLSDRAEAVFDSDTLFFRSYYRVNRFLDLTDYFHDATDVEIKEVFKHPILVAEDQDQTLAVTDQWMRRRFGIVQQTGILDGVSARKIRDTAKRCKLTVAIKRVKGKEAIVFPSEKKQAKRMLTFLCEGYFHGELTNQLYMTNSQRPVTV